MYSTPLACHFTFNPYGNWLHGDPRGSVDALHNAYDTPRLAPDEELLRRRKASLKHDPVYLDARRRAAVEASIRGTAAFRGWTIHAINVRTNHVHAVIAIGETDPARVLNAIKGNATRAMREAGCWNYAHSPWADGGSKRYLFKQKDVDEATAYVQYGQGEDI